MLCNKGLRSHKSINCSMSGSTGVVAFLQVLMYIFCILSAQGDQPCIQDCVKYHNTDRERRSFSQQDVLTRVNKSCVPDILNPVNRHYQHLCCSQPPSAASCRTRGSSWWPAWETRAACWAECCPAGLSGQSRCPPTMFLTTQAKLRVSASMG